MMTYDVFRIAATDYKTKIVSRLKKEEGFKPTKKMRKFIEDYLVENLRAYEHATGITVMLKAGLGVVNPNLDRDNIYSNVKEKLGVSSG